MILVLIFSTSKAGCQMYLQIIFWITNRSQKINWRERILVMFYTKTKQHRSDRVATLAITWWWRHRAVWKMLNTHNKKENKRHFKADWYTIEITFCEYFNTIANFQIISTILSYSKIASNRAQLKIIEKKNNKKVSPVPIKVVFV